MSETHNDVSLVFSTTDQILDELGKRYPHVVLVYTGQSHSLLDNCTDTDFSYRGGFIPALGLVTYAQYELLQHNESIKDEDNE